MRALDARTQRRNVRVQAHVFHLAHDLCDICLFTADAEQLVQARAELVPSDPNVRPLHIVVVCVSGHCQGEDEKQNWVDEQRERERVCVCVSTRACMSVCVCLGETSEKRKKARFCRQAEIDSVQKQQGGEKPQQWVVSICG